MSKLATILGALLFLAGCVTGTGKPVATPVECEAGSQTLRSSVASVMGNVFTSIQEKRVPTHEDYLKAIAMLDALVDKIPNDLCPYEKATLLELRASYKAQLSPPNRSGAIADFQRAIELDALPATRQNKLEYFVCGLEATRDCAAEFPEIATLGDRDAQPLVRIPPRHPASCRVGTHVVRGQRTRVTVEFDVTNEGEVINPRIVSSEAECLNTYALAAVKRWKYQPKIVGGEPRPRTGVVTSFIFLLDR